MSPSPYRPWIAALLVAAFGVSCGRSDDRTVVVRDDTATRVDVRLIFNAGPGFDPPDSPGLAMACATLLAQPLDIQMADPRLVRSYTGGDVVVFDLVVEKSAWSTMANLIPLMFKLERLSKIDQVQLDALSVSLSDSLRSDHHRIARLLIDRCLAGSGDAVHGRDATGADALRQFHSAHYAQDYFLGASGAIQEAELKVLDQLLRATLPASNPIPNASKSTDIQGFNVLVVEDSTCLSPVIAIGCGANTTTTDTTSWVLAMAAQQQGVPGTSAGSLDEGLRIERGMVESLDIATNYVASTASGFALETDSFSRKAYFIIQTQTNPVNPPMFIRIVLKELENLAARGLSQTEIDAAKAAILDAIPNEQDYRLRMQWELGQMWRRGPSDRESLARLLNAITPTSSRHYLRTGIDAENLWIVVVTAGAQRFADQLVQGVLTYQYKSDADLRELREADQTYLSFRPFFRLSKVRVVRPEDVLP